MRACERALARAARAQGAGSRQQVRAAARRFVRRHRRDAGYLAWVLRSVRASSALAVALLGLAAAPAHAGLAPDLPLTGAANPLSGFSATSRSAPAFADLDTDGDLDAVAGQQSGAFSYFRNDGTPLAPAFVPATGGANPLNGQSAGASSRPALGDLNGDGRIDLVSGAADGTFAYFQNTGLAIAPAFILVTGGSDPLNTQDAGADSAPALGDLDSDGDLDLVVGEQGGALLYFRNTGTAMSPAFAEVTGAGNPWNGQDLGSNSQPALADLDDDGDLDLVAGELAGGFAVFENTGNANSPAFVVRTGDANPLIGRDVGDRSSPALGDFDGDTDPDLVSGEDLGGFAAFEHAGRRMVPRTGAANPLDGQNAGSDSAPAFGDLDGDGDRDLVVGASDGTFHYFRNGGSATSAAFAEQTGAANPLDLQDVGDAAMPALGDLDADGDLDLISGAFDGTFRYFRNTGTVTDPAFTHLPAQNPMTGVDVGDRAAPALTDLNGDGDLDLLAGEDGGGFLYFENTGTPAVPAFVEQTGGSNPMNAIDLGTRTAPAFGDRNGDGDRDLFIGVQAGNFILYENTGGPSTPMFQLRTGSGDPLDGQSTGSTASAPALGDLDSDGDPDFVSGSANGLLATFESFVAQVPKAYRITGSADPLAGIVAGTLSAPALGDLDGDGDLDLVAGETAGIFHYFENTGSATHPEFAELTGAENPLDGETVGGYSSAALGDLDGDGDLDLVAGSDSGSFFYFRNVGTAVAPDFTEINGAGNPLSGESTVSWSVPALADLDGDGDLDLVAGEYGGGFYYFENTGSATVPGFDPATGVDNPLDAADVGAYSAPALADFDGDGDVDLVAGNDAGDFDYFNNSRNATIPAFSWLTGTANPLAGQDVGNGSAPAAGDLDGNGTPDLVTGESTGALNVHYLPEPARGVLLAAGISLLALFERLRPGKRR